METELKLIGNHKGEADEILRARDEQRGTEELCSDWRGGRERIEAKTVILNIQIHRQTAWK